MPPPQQRNASIRGGLALTLGTVLVCLVLAELAGRALSSSASLWSYPNYIWLAIKPTFLATLRYDGELGYEPVPGASGTLRGQTISFSAEGTRNHNLQSPAKDGPLIVALGDSFTEGYGVGDDETWPAYLERDGTWQVRNAGVRGYGLDQIVLRARRLADRIPAKVFVLAFIADDIERTTLRAREHVAKPYFVASGQGLALANVPTPQRHGLAQLDGVRWFLGHSYLLNFVMTRLGAYELWYGLHDRAHDAGDLVSCRLMDEFATIVRRHGAKGLIVSFVEAEAWQEPPKAAADGKRTRAVLDCARRAGLATLDTEPAFAAAGVAERVRDYYAVRHFTPAGNRLAAKTIASAVRAMAE